ncbi:MAG: S41 family peptidase [Flavobacteriales bacterium]|nr:S41 family peptidase [Flavobacteriales bacterium]
MTKPPSFYYIIFCCLFFACSHQKTSISQTVILQEQDSTSIEKISISQTLKQNEHLPIEKRIALYYQLKKESPTQYNFKNEDELNMYGYSLLWSNRPEEALAIFKLIVAEFPHSSNAYDSLGEAYLALGNEELSLLNYEKSLELNPDNFNAEDQIERIKFPDKIPEKPADKFFKTYTVKEYREDLDQLAQKLIEIHPATFKFTPEEDFKALIEEKKAAITKTTTYGEFSWHCAEIIASVNCSHTSSGRFYPQREMLPPHLWFPIQVRWVNDHLYVVDPLNNKDKVALKDEITAINGIAVKDMIEDIYKHIPSQGHIETTKRIEFNSWAPVMIPYTLEFPEKYEITIKGKKNSIVLNKAEKMKILFFDPSIPYCGNNLCLEFLEEEKTAVLTVSSFNYYAWNALDEFEDFMDSSFALINSKGTKNLVIDLRFNGGGSPESSIYLLRYLSSKPFHYYGNADYPGAENKQQQIPFENAFKGNNYFIIDGLGNSTTGHFMSMVKELNLGITVGEELGSNHFCTAGQATCRLSNSKLMYYVANNSNSTSAKSLPDNRGIFPDYEVVQNIDDYLNKVDAVKDFTFQLIKKSNQ